ncbi:hypothetical protein DFJ73DRAFT_532716 [Zopfochytrium polystomum]|nr:hypothetical protein DFJ73DRAFT_532716 [Zopfochytrium polystomum]
MAELEVFLDENGFEIQSDGRQKGEMTLRVVKKQMVSSLSGSPAISVALFDQPAAHMAADSQPESHGASGRTISLPPSPSHAAASIASTDGTAKKAPSRLAQAILASLPVSFVKRLVKKRNGGQDRKMSMIGTRTGSRIEGVLISDDSKSVSNMGDSGIELPIDTAFPNPSSEGQSNESGPSSTASDLPSTGPSASPLPVTKQLVSASARDEKESTKTEPSKKNIGSAAASNAKDDFKFSVEIEPVPNHSGLHVVHFKRIRGDAWEFKRLYHKAMKDVLDKE